MTTIRIELPDEQAAALRTKAASEGLSLEDWFRRRADQEIRPRKGRYTLEELVEQCDPHAPLSVEDREWMDFPAVGREALGLDRGDIFHVDLNPTKGREQA
jgi:hypothetical protein